MAYNLKDVTVEVKYTVSFDADNIPEEFVDLLYDHEGESIDLFTPSDDEEAKIADWLRDRVCEDDAHEMSAEITMGDMYEVSNC